MNSVGPECQQKTPACGAFIISFAVLLIAFPVVQSSVVTKGPWELNRPLIFYTYESCESFPQTSFWPLMMQILVLLLWLHSPHVRCLGHTSC